MARFRCKSCLRRGRPRRERVRSRPMDGDHPCRRVWGQRPGQPDAGPAPSASRRGPRTARGGSMELRPDGTWDPHHRSASGRSPSTSSRASSASSRRLARVEVEVIAEKNPRQGGIHRVEARRGDAPQDVSSSRATLKEVERALDVVAERLERQIRDHHERRRARLIAGATRVKSAQEPPGGSRARSGGLRVSTGRPRAPRGDRRRSPRCSGCWSATTTRCSVAASRWCSTRSPTSSSSARPRTAPRWSTAPRS